MNHIGDLSQEQLEKNHIFFELGENNSFHVAIATVLKDLNAATMFFHINHWISVNRRGNRNFIEGRTWTRQTIQKMADHFPYWSKDQIWRILKKLEKNGVLIKGKFNRDKTNQTLWYSIDYENLSAILRNRNLQHVAKSQSPIMKDNKEDDKEEIYVPSPKPKPQKKVASATMSPLADASVRLCSYLFSKLKEKNPKAIKPNIKKHSKEFLKPLETYSEEDIMKVIDWAYEVNHFYLQKGWGRHAPGFCKYFQSMYDAMTENSVKRERSEEENQALAIKLKKKIKNPQAEMVFEILHKEVEIGKISHPLRETLEYKDKNFESKLINTLKRYKYLEE